MHREVPVSMVRHKFLSNSFHQQHIAIMSTKSHMNPTNHLRGGFRQNTQNTKYLTPCWALMLGRPAWLPDLVSVCQSICQAQDIVKYGGTMESPGRGSLVPWVTVTGADVGARIDAFIPSRTTSKTLCSLEEKDPYQSNRSLQLQCWCPLVEGDCTFAAWALIRCNQFDMFFHKCLAKPSCSQRQWHF